MSYVLRKTTIRFGHRSWRKTMSRKVSVFVVCVCGLLGMSRMTAAQDDLFAEPVPVAQPPIFAPAPAAQPHVGSRYAPIPQTTSQIRALQVEILDAVDDKARDALAAELEKLVEEIYDMELKQMKDSLARMQKDITKREAKRDAMIEERIAKLLDPNAAIGGPAGEKPYFIESIKKQKDGSSIAKVRITKRTPQTQQQTYTVMIPQTRTRMVNGKEQSYTVKVPEQRTRTVTVMATSTGEEVHTVTIPKGKNKDRVLTVFAKEKLRRR